MLARTVSAAIAAIALATLPVHAQDKSKAAPPKADAKEIQSESKVLFENDKVRVTEFTFKPGAVSRTDRKARVNYFLSDAKMQRTDKEGKTTQAERKKGTALWLEADSDVVKNIGNTTLVGISVVQK